MVGEVSGGGRWRSVRKSCAVEGRVREVVSAQNASFRLGAKKTRGADAPAVSIAASEDVLSEAVKARRRGSKNDFLATEKSSLKIVQL